MNTINRLILFLLLGTQCLTAQQFQAISTGPDYINQAFVNLNSDVQTTISNDSWDLAFACYSRFVVAIRMNESSGLNPVESPGISIYNTRSTDFNSTPNIDSILKYQLYNNDSLSWEAGALNNAANPSDPFDYGWGSYNPASHSVDGSRVFVIKLRDGSYKKFKITGQVNGIYYIIHGDLNITESEAQTQEINTADFNSSYFAYFKFKDNSVTNLEPYRYDLVYQRYITTLDAGAGQYLDYTLTGLLGSPNTKVAQADQIDPSTVDYRNYISQMNTVPDVIGHDWKEYVNNSYSIVENRVYFVQIANGDIYKLKFIDFEGAATGTAVFEKTWVGKISAAVKNELVSSAIIYPQPAANEVNIVFTPKSSNPQSGLIIIKDLNGKKMMSTSIKINSGLNAIQINTSSFPPGQYILQLEGNNAALTQKIQIIK